MKKLILIILLAMSCQVAQATESVFGDLFTFENKHSSFTVDVEAGKFDAMSIQVVFSSQPILDASFGNANIDLTNDTISVAGNTLGQGQPVYIASSTAPSPLVLGSTYYVLRINDSLLKLATSYAQAVSRDTIDLLTAPAGTWTLRPAISFLGAPAFTWQGSNDGVNYVDVASVGSTVNGSTQSLVGLTSTVQTRLFDWGNFAYRLLRFKYFGPAGGAINLRAYLFAKVKK